MRGIVFPGHRIAELREFPDPRPGPGDVVVAIRASGMCGSDLHVYRGDPATGPGELLIQGHEPCGEVVAVGQGVRPHVAAVGDRVMIHHYWGCATCEQCRSGWPQLCTTMTPRVPTLNEHGAHAEYMKVPAVQTLPLSNELSFKAGAAIGCGTGTAWGALARMGDIAGKTMVILGQGPVGLSATMLASAMGVRVIAVDIADSRLARAAAFGAHTTLNSSAVDLGEAVGELTAGRGAELVLETSGATVAAGQAFNLVATWGTICLVGIGADIAFNTKDTLRRQLTITTSWTLSTVDQIRCAAFIEQRQLPVDDLFSHHWSLGQATEAYTWFDQQSEGKGVFVA